MIDVCEVQVGKIQDIRRAHSFSDGRGECRSKLPASTSREQHYMFRTTAQPIAHCCGLFLILYPLMQMLTEFEQLIHIKSELPLSEKLNWVSNRYEVQHYLADHPILNRYLDHLPKEEIFVIKSVIAIGQGHLFDLFKRREIPIQQMEAFVQTLASLEQTYEAIGGIIGYHCLIMRLMARAKIKQLSPTPHSYQKPPAVEITHDTFEVRQAILWGIEALPQLAELYPLGGAGDRLDLHSVVNGEPLPAACLSFCGKTLLEGLIRDLQAREYLYYKLYGKQLHTPIIMMTSLEKNNQAHIQRIFKEEKWFGRHPDSFRFLLQPVVPMVAETGEWITTAPLQLLLKPGGHGFIWKLAEEQGVFEWLKAKGYTHVLVRQVNNPIAGSDYGLSAFTGWGYHNKKLFGFSSCPRLCNTAQGMDVLIETEGSMGFQYCISNIEYTEFAHLGIENVPEHPDSPYSRFPANTNILFADIQALHSSVKNNPLPGLIVNMKSSLSHTNGTEVCTGRLESTMQSIADTFTDLFPNKLLQVTPEMLSTFLTYNTREKTISAIKNSYSPEKSILETPEGCFYDLLQNNRQLLIQYCNFHVPEIGSTQEYLERGPGVLFLFHPALGPLYRVIAAKLREGRCAWGSELQLEIAELDISGLNLEGSLLVTATEPLGHTSESDSIVYSGNGGKCVLKNISVLNRGIDHSAKNCFWKNQIQRHESLQIILHGNGEFFAENVEFKGNLLIEVPAGQRLTVKMQHGKLDYHLERIQAPSWQWEYSIAQDASIQLRTSLL